ncbi:thiamine pyrophosphate-binding protein [archaeon]|jgi:acetolactate synthase I/II/III large subunit|nr:thiamine pyrophosphate-binding protein [archaeon]MBT3451345.1 thiamine pyrophosphate-binding protein [archaeon]MBT6869339.1 thiamine pyrophosphate-binding protein [archaeon]MBT7192502.1 thiamine pyrophosphate-binding protein [archaeon]MBT7380578.1 thiamine pyrophosphate-binding protein [archaeon]
MNGAELLVKTLEDNKVNYIFGVPGDIQGEYLLFKALDQSNINFVYAGNEQSGVMMADGFARVKGDIGVCFSTLGPGATNLVTGLANAMQDNVPILALSGQLPYSKQFIFSHQYVDTVRLFDSRDLTMSASQVGSAQSMHRDVNRAIVEALSGPRGPVHVTIPSDVLTDNAESYPEVTINEEVIYRDDVQISRLEGLLKENNSAVAIVGPGVARAGASSELIQFLERTNIPAYTTFHGKGTMPNNHALNIGVLSRHSKVAKKVLNEKDIILTIGYGPEEGVTPEMWQEAKHVVHINASEPRGVHIYNPKLEVIGDLRNVLSKIGADNQLRMTNQKLDEMRLVVEMPDNIDEMFPYHPVQVVRILNETLNSDSLVFSDVGLHKQALGLYCDKQTYFSNGLSAMGYAIPAAVGACFAAPNKQVVAVTGDGGFQMGNDRSLLTAKEYGHSPIIIVMNDGALGMVESRQLTALGTTHYARFKENPNFKRIAEAYGCKGYRIEESGQLESVLKDSLNHDKPVVIDVPIQAYHNVKMMK